MKQELDVREFRRALAQFPTGVTVVTTVDSDGEPVGVTASSFNSVSIDPPLILWSVAKNAHSAKVFGGAEHFTVNVLGKQQADLSNNFARQGGDKFANIDCEPGLGGCPVLSGTAACFECRTWNLYEGGDHIIVVGEVVDYQASESVMPLVFSRGSYAISSPQTPPKSPDSARCPDDGFLSNYLLYQLHTAYSCYAAELYPLLMSEFGISPEEWRILTLLADVSSMEFGQLARMVMQPEEECRDCLQRLSERGYIVNTAEGSSTAEGSGESVRINRSGVDIAGRLFAMAKSHEQTILDALSKEQQEMLNASLGE